MKKNQLVSIISLLLAVMLLAAGCAPRVIPAPLEEPEAPALTQEEKEPKLPPLTLSEGVTDVDLLPAEWEALIQEGKHLSVKTREIQPISNAAAPQFNLTIPTNFRVTRPEKAITTEYETYFIMGTSDPSQPLYFDGQEVERLGTQGTWGVHVELSMGQNTFTARQGDSSTTITITRTARKGTQPISTITKSSMYPATQGGVRAGGTMPVECVAPSGATVVASFGGQSVTLQQAANANAGIPATFRGELPVGNDYPEGVTTKIGKVSYRLTYNGSTTDHQSEGDVYVAGPGGYIAIQVTEYQGFVYDDPAKPSVFREKLKTGATDYVYSDSNRYFRLYSGGYISKDQCKIIEGQVKIGNKITSVSSSMGGKRERYTFHGTSTPAYRAVYGQDNTFFLTVYNTNGAQPVDVSGSQLFSSVTATTNDNSSVTYAFKVKNPSLFWGHNVQYSGTDLTISFSVKPGLTGGNQPLTGIKIVLDPGHGNQDSGALGLAGIYGPTEALLNLAHSYAVRDRLVTLGAEVVMTRTQQNEFLTLDQRLQFFEKSDADLFVSIHHNSLAESSNGNQVFGTEAYYHTPYSGGSTDKLVQSYSLSTDRKNRGANQGYFRVTLLPLAPSMLLEMGFLCNPVEYENSCNTNMIQKSAQGVADGIMAMFW